MAMEPIEYKSYLMHPYWELKRNNILHRDKYLCQDCHKEGQIRILSDNENNSTFNVALLEIDKSDLICDYYMNNQKFYALYLIQDYDKDGGIDYAAYIKAFVSHSEDPILFNVIEDKLKSNEYISCELMNIYGNLFNAKQLSDIYIKACLKTSSSNVLQGNYLSEYSLANENNLNKNKALLRYFEYPDELQVHHKYYVKGKYPWQYPDDAFITLCPECHKKLHSKENIPVYNNEKIKIGLAQTCQKCEGLGFIPEYYYHLNGICFDCWGEGVKLL